VEGFHSGFNITERVVSGRVFALHVKICEKSGVRSLVGHYMGWSGMSAWGGVIVAGSDLYGYLHGEFDCDTEKHVN